MTDKEKAIVMAYTGVCMLAGEKFPIYHKYVEDILERKVFTHEMGVKSVAEEIKQKSRNDFLNLCKEGAEALGKWIEKDGWDGDVYYDCSVCGESWATIEGTPWDNDMNYCPHCGAKMEGAEE